MNAILNYFLPKESIAQSPIFPRDACRLLIIKDKIFEHKKFHNIINYLKKDDILIFNDTKVRKVRVFCKKKSGGKLELLIISGTKNLFKCLIKGKCRIGITFLINDVEGVIQEKNDEIYTINIPLTIEEIESVGVLPTPPYIKKIVTKDDWYQTIFAKEKGSIAAPTAGLHFTPGLLEKINKKGIIMTSILLHVGLGTFLQTKNRDYMKEYYRLGKEQADLINNAEGRVYAVGTTTVKTLESSSKNQIVYPSDGWSDLFITLKHNFQSPIDGLITNFHMPNSPPLKLTASFAGPDILMNAYKEALNHNYRFLSLGDSMLIIPCSK